MIERNVFKCFDNGDFGVTFVNDNDFETMSSEEIKSFMQQLGSYLIKNLNKKSQNDVLKVIRILNKYHPLDVQTHLKLAFLPLGKILISSHLHVNGNRGFGISSLFGLSILIDILQTIQAGNNSDDIKSLLQFLVLLPSGCYLSGRKKIILKCKCMMNRFLQQNTLFNGTMSKIIDLGESKPHFLSFVIMISDSKNVFLKEETLINYAKFCFNDKYQIPIEIVDRIGPLLQCTISNRIAFDEHLLPSMTKMVLRSPEKALSIVSIMLKQLSHLDLSQSNQELVKVLLTQVQSKNELLRSLAKDSIIEIVKLTSDRNSLEKIIGVMLSLLHGPDKVAHLDTRLIIFSIITEIPKHISLRNASAKTTLSQFVLSRLISSVAKETQETIILGTLECVSAWSRFDTNAVSPMVATLLKENAFNVKNSTAIKFAYYTCLNESYDKTQKLITLSVSPIQETLEKLSKMSMLTAGVHEVLPLVEVLIRYCVNTDNVADQDPMKPNTIPSLIFTVCGLKTSVANAKMFSDQSLQTATIKSLVNLTTIIRYLLTFYYDILVNIPDHLALIIRSLVLCSLHDNYKTVRKHSLDVMTQVARCQYGPSIVELVLEYLQSRNLSDCDHFKSFWFWPIENAGENLSSYDCDAFRPLVQRVSQLVDALLDLEYAKKSQLSSGVKYPLWWDDLSRAKVMHQALRPLNQHMITLFYPNIWPHHAERLIGNTDCIIELVKNFTIERIINLDRLDKNDISVLKCLCLNFSDKLINNLLQSVVDVLNRESFFSCTENEVGIMNTREGYLFNKILLHSLPKYEANKTNIKRENKLYSYKDQMASMEIKREIEDKKKKSAQNANKVESDNPIDILKPNLTKNHMEQIGNELAREKQIRLRVKELERKVTVMSEIIRQISETRKQCFLGYFDEILTILEKLITKSPIGRMQASLLFNDLHSITTLNKKQSIWILRVLFFDSATFDDDMKENWKYNSIGQELMQRLEVFTQDDLCEYSTENIDKLQDHKLDFATFIYVLPALCRLCEAIADMESLDLVEKNEQVWTYLTWMDINLLSKILIIVKHQIEQKDVDRRQLFSSELLQVLVKVTQNTEIHDVHQRVDEIVLKMMSMLNVDANDTQMLKSNVFETILNCYVSNTMEARLLALNCIDTVNGIELKSLRKLSLYVRVAMCDVREPVASKAADIWAKLGLSDDEEMIIEMVDFAVCAYEQVTSASIKAMTELIDKYRDQLKPLISHIFILYSSLAYVKPPVCDDFGRVLIDSPPDRWVSRLGLAKALISLSRFLSHPTLVLELFNFFIPEALNDRNQHVRYSMLEAGQKVIEHFDKTDSQEFTTSYMCSLLLPILENYLNTAANIAANDIVRQSVIILMGSLAKHLDAHDERFNIIFGKLIEALNFPSEDVQRSVSDTFDPLIKAFSEERQNNITNCLIDVLFNSKELAERKGAAFGIAGIIKAVGITKLKTFKIYDNLLEGIQNKNNEVHREIALFTYEQISAKMGKKFEPYVPQLIKFLLETFADPSPRVRETACRTARMLMSNLSAPGVKVVLGPLLSGLDTNQWRTKAVSVELLGSMAYCAPKQLSNCLPTIVPKILSILSDSHQNVIKSGRQALREIGSVIQNKEIEAIVPVLIDALCDPIHKTDDGLDCLIATKFVHQVDAPSLAIIMSMVSRAFKERRSDTKRKAAQIIANLQSLIDDKDLEPYCASLMPGLKTCLVDPDPGVREVASIALGTIAKVMEPPTYEELMIWLMEALKDEQSGVNRSGAAQGLSEVLLQKGVVHLDKFMPDILENTGNAKLLSHVRDGYLMLYIYLPKRFQDQFAKYVKEILPSILQALSDEVEYIRETALNAGQGIIDIYSHIAIDTMLPNLERGMLDPNWRIRYSSIKLLGELLFRLTGISGKGTTVGGNDDESFAQASSQTVVEESLGADRYRHVLAEIFVARMDVALQVRQAAIHIWKLMVVNTARALRLIMADLMALVLECLSGDDSDNRVMATKALGDVVKKLGERSLPEIFGYLEAGFGNCLSRHRIGVCNAVLEILKACPKEQIVNFLDKVLPTFKSCLCDSNPEVRQVAGEIFELLHSSLGVRIVDIVIPDLVDRLDDDQADQAANALNGLCTLVHLKGRFVIPSLIPRLTHPTVNTKAFSELAKVAGDILSRHIATVLPALLLAVSNVIDCANEQSEVDNCCQVILAMDDSQTTQVILKELTTAFGNSGGSSNGHDQIAGLKIMAAYMRQSEDVTGNKVLMNYVPIVIRAVVRLFAAEQRAVLLAAFDCLTEIVSSLGASNVEYVKDVRDAILVVIRERSSLAMASATGDREEVLVPAFCLEERGIGPLVDLYREALVNGRADLKEVAAGGLEDCISATATPVLAKAATKVSGPLIRTMSERHHAHTKATIVSSLGKLVCRCPQQMKLFVTQMQTIFAKCLADPDQMLRQKAAGALAQLAKVVTKPDLFFMEMLAREVADGNQFRDTGLEAVRLCLETAGARLTRETLLAMSDLLQTTLADKDDQVRLAGSACLAVALSRLATDQDLQTRVKSLLEAAGRGGVLYGHGLAVCLMVLCKEAPRRLPAVEGAVPWLEESCASDRVFLATTAYRAVGFLAADMVREGQAGPLTPLLALLNNGMKQQSLEVKEAVVEAICGLCWADEGGLQVAMYSRAAVAALINGYRAKESSLRARSERALLDLVRLSAGLRRSLGDGAVDEGTYRAVADCLEAGTRAALAEVVARARRASAGPREALSRRPDLDNSYLGASAAD